MEISFLSSSKIEGSLGISWPLQKHRKMMKACMASGELISMTSNKKNLYKVLSLDSENVGVDEIKKAYRSMALRCHPDVCPPCRREESTRMFVEIQRAYETLSDPVLRKRYDYELHLVGCRENSPINDVMRWGFAKQKQAWINQLHGLQETSNQRMRRRSTAFV